LNDITHVQLTQPGM